MDFVVKGTVLPVLEATLQPGETLISTHGDLGWMTPTIQLSQTTGGKGFFKAAKRVVGGAGLFLTRYTSEGGPGHGRLPGQAAREHHQRRRHPAAVLLRPPLGIPVRHRRHRGLRRHAAEARRAPSSAAWASSSST